MKDGDVGKIWKTCFDAERDDMVDRPLTIKRLICKLVEERSNYYYAKGWIDTDAKALDDFGIDPTSFRDDK